VSPGSAGRGRERPGVAVASFSSHPLAPSPRRRWRHQSPGRLLSAGYLVKCFLNERLMEEERWLQRTEPQGYPCRRAGCWLPAPAVQPGEGGCDHPRGGFGGCYPGPFPDWDAFRSKSYPRWGRHRAELPAAGARGEGRENRKGHESSV